MNRYALALLGLGLFAGVACKCDDSPSNYEVNDAATPMTLSITGMT
jgi:hypothetical protein